MVSDTTDRGPEMEEPSVPRELQVYRDRLNIDYVCDEIEARQLRRDTRAGARHTDRYCYLIGEEQGKYRIRATVHGNNTVTVEAIGPDEHFMPRKSVIELAFYAGPQNKSRIRDALSSSRKR